MFDSIASTSQQRCEKLGVCQVTGWKEQYVVLCDKHCPRRKLFDVGEVQDFSPALYWAGEVFDELR
ncbi:hypothetical protein COCON_G00152990 [Conger conger]|uniref:Uncharacterized protein n=1 Tax=Conger conger TaxID=82655 RepID=A0A9Q1D8J3_CONCO|nr:hypothetical protein COCON_G00152990 [Conger conger]